MEDGIEMHRCSLYDRIIEKEREIVFQNININSNTNTDINKKSDTNDFLYIYLPQYGDISDCIVTNNTEKALDLSQNKKCKMQIFKRNKTGVYQPIYNGFD
jgi:hypothetical protein